MRRTLRSARSGRALWLTLLVATVTLGPGARAAAAGAGSWHTSGNQILDANGQVVRIAGINWYGFETTDKVIHGLWCQDWHTIVNTIKSLGYNVVRMPFSDDMVSSPIFPTNIGASNGAGPTNRDVIGLDSLTIMDRVIQTLGDVGIRVILDNHRSTAGNSAQENGLWYTPDFSEQTLIANWVTLVRRYKDFRDPQGNPIVVGADLRNEPHLNVAGAPTGACWTGDTATGGCPVTSARNWPEAAERIGNAILAENPDLLVIVEGAECYDGDCDWWGGNLQGVARHPVVLDVPDRLVYSAHDYGPNLFRQKWFTSSTTCDSLAAVWDRYWGYISRDGIAPVLVGEFGANNGDYTGTAPGSQGQWFQCLVQYIKARPHLHWTYWALNGEDDYGLLGAQYEPTLPSPGKHALLAPMQFPLEGGGGLSCATPNIPTNFTATAVSAGRVDLQWSAVPSPGAGCAVTYDVFRSTEGTGMTPSAANRIATGVTGTAYSDTTVAGSTTYYYLVEAVDITVASPPSSKTSATTPQGGTTYALTVTRSGLASGGAVLSSPSGIQCGTTCSATYAAGTVVTLTAAPVSGYVFNGWSGPCTGTASTCVVIMSAAQTVGATFLACAAPASVLTVTKGGTGAGTVTSSPAGISCGATCTMTVSSCGAVPVVVLTAAPAAGSVFTGWGGPCTGTGATCSVPLTGNVAVTASFTLGTSYTLTVSRSGTGSGTVTSSSGGISCGTVCAATFASGSTVTVTAATTSGSFAGWSGACTGTSVICVVSMTANRAVTATFNTCPSGSATITKSGTGTGTITSSTDATCGPSSPICQIPYGCSSSLTLTAAPSAGSRFAGWSGGCTGTSPTCTLTSLTRDAGAAFELVASYPLTVTRSGSGAGTVTSRPAGIDCGSSCSATLAAGTTVTLTASAAAGSTFTGWSGPCTGTSLTCVVSMTGSRAVTASFSQNPCARWVPVTKLGPGTGTVRSSDGKIDCGATCEAILGCSESLTLTATAAAGSRFAGWGGTCSGTGTCTANGGEVTATFELADATPCASPITFSNNTGNFGTTGAVCYRTAQRVNGWGCSNFSGRTITVNGGTATASCGAGPFPLAQVGGYTYFSATAGSFPWASIYVW